MWIWIVEMWKYYEIFPLNSYTFYGYNFASFFSASAAAYVVLSVEGKNMSFTTHTKGKEGIYFIPDKIDFYFISAFLLKHNKGGWGTWEWDGKMRVIVSEEEKQFVTEYHSEKKGRKNVCGVGKK